MPEQNDPEQLVLMQRMVDLSVERTRMSAERSEMSAERSYLAAERTLSVWVRTALAMMVLGIAIDRFGLFLARATSASGPPGSDTVPHGAGAALVALGVFMVTVTGIRFRSYAASYCRKHEIPAHHGPFLAPTFALLVALFGVGMFVFMLIAV